MRRSLKGYLYETHLHTCQGSACGVSEGKEYPVFYQDMGYDGIFVTDHFFQGNCAAPRTGPWEARVDAYMRGYFDALEAGEKIGFKVFFGIEQNYEGDEYLLYGLDRAFLLAHPDIESWPRTRLFHEVRAYGGCAVQAHPFRDRGYIRRLHLQLSGVDGVEAVNTANHPWEDACGLRYTRHLGLPATCGSDVHNLETMTPGRLGGVRLEEEMLSGRDYAAYIRARKPVEPVYCASRLDGNPPRMPEQPYAAYDGENEIQNFDLESILF